jgi:hypothetical protein
MDDDGSEPRAIPSKDSDRTAVPGKSRRAVLAASLALSTGCLRLSEDGQSDGANSSEDGQSDSVNSPEDGQGDSANSSEATDDESSQSDTDNSSSDQPADTIRIASAEGFVNEDGDALAAISMTVRGGDSNSEEIDLSAMSIEYAGPEGDKRLFHASRRPPAFYISPIRTENDSNSLITTEGGFYDVQIPFRDSPFFVSTFRENDPVDDTNFIDNPELEPLEEGETASFRLTTQAGATATVDVTVPDSLDDSAGDSVRL